MTIDGVAMAKKMPIACEGWGLEKVGIQVRTKDKWITVKENTIELMSDSSCEKDKHARWEV